MAQHRPALPRQLEISITLGASTSSYFICSFFKESTWEQG